MDGLHRGGYFGQDWTAGWKKGNHEQEEFRIVSSLAETSIDFMMGAPVQRQDGRSTESSGRQVALLLVCLDIQLSSFCNALGLLH